MWLEIVGSSFIIIFNLHIGHGGGSIILSFSDEDAEAQISNIKFKNVGWGGKRFLWRARW